MLNVVIFCLVKFLIIVGFFRGLRKLIIILFFCNLLIFDFFSILILRSILVLCYRVLLLEIIFVLVCL